MVNSSIDVICVCLKVGTVTSFETKNGRNIEKLTLTVGDESALIDVQIWDKVCYAHDF